jgi:sugar/nucleoside kinase (ribokinase family)
MNKIIGIGNALVDIIIKLQDEEVLKTFSLPKGSMQLVDIIAAGIKPYISHGNEPTGRAITLVSPDSERTFATFLGSAIELNSQDLDDIPFSNYSVLHVEGYLVQNQKLVEGVLKIAKLNGLKTSLDLSSYNVVSENKEFLRNTIRQYVDIVFANEEEAHALTGKNPEEAAEELALICNIAVVKTGGSGSIVQKGKEQSRIGVVDAHCIDTTGAGDLYAAGFLYGLSRNLHVSRCGKIGALLAGKVIEYLGAKIPSSGWNEIKKLKDLIT